MEKMGKRSSLTLRSIFRYMMENGYYPVYEKTHITFEFKGNLAVLELDEDILCIRLFFSIEEDDYDNMLEASNACMLKTYMIKPALLDDMASLMFSCECICMTYRDFTRFFPRMTSMLEEAVGIHKEEMKQIILTEGIAKAVMPAAEESAAGIIRKPLS